MEWQIEGYNSQYGIILEHEPDRCGTEDIFEFNGFVRHKLLNDIVPASFGLSYDFDLWTHKKRNDFIVDWSDSHGGVLIFYCKNQQQLLNCLKDISKIMLNLLQSQKILREFVLEEKLAD